MTSSLVGSEMCIRDSPGPLRGQLLQGGPARPVGWQWAPGALYHLAEYTTCLLYTSDAADDM
eukprot:6046087-Prorocentrum_lima.AAC.1